MLEDKRGGGDGKSEAADRVMKVVRARYLHKEVARPPNTTVVLPVAVELSVSREDFYVLVTRVITQQWLRKWLRIKFPKSLL
jgi:hypothetical protein